MLSKLSYSDVLRGGGGGEQKRMERPRRLAASKVIKPPSPKRAPPPAFTIKKVANFEGGHIPEHFDQERLPAVLNQRKNMIEAMSAAERQPYRGNLRNAYSLQKNMEPIEITAELYYRPNAGFVATVCNQIGHSFLEVCPNETDPKNISMTKTEYELLVAILRDSPGYKIYREFPDIVIPTKELRLDQHMKTDKTGQEVLLDRAGKIIGDLEGFQPLDIKGDGNCALHCLALIIFREENAGHLMRLLLMFFIVDNFDALASMDDYLYHMSEGDLFNLFGCLAATNAYVPLTAFAVAAQMFPGLGISVTSLDKDRLVANTKDPYLLEHLYVHRDYPISTLKVLAHLLYIPSGSDPKEPKFNTRSPLNTRYELDHYVLLIGGDRNAPTQEEVIRKWSEKSPNTLKPLADKDQILIGCREEAVNHYMVSLHYDP